MVHHQQQLRAYGSYQTRSCAPHQHHDQKVEKDHCDYWAHLQAPFALHHDGEGEGEGGEGDGVEVDHHHHLLHDAALQHDHLRLTMLQL